MNNPNRFAEKNGKEIVKMVDLIAEKYHVNAKSVLHLLYKQLEKITGRNLDEEKKKLAMEPMQSQKVTTFTLIKTDEDLFSVAMDICEELLGKSE